MIGFLFVMLATTLFMLLGYSLLAGSFFMFMNVTILISLGGLGFIAVFGLIWEFWFQKPAKTLIANRNAASYELAVDDLGYGELTASKRYMPEGLVQYRFGWSLLPRPMMKLSVMARIRRLRKKGAELTPAQEQAEKQRAARDKQVQEIEAKADALAEQIALKKCILKGTGKPLWLQYIGLAANFNPYVLVPDEIKQDNPREYFTQMRSWLAGATFLTEDAKTQLNEKLKELESHVDHVRVVVDPRRFKEIHPKMYTQSQVDDHGRIHFNLGRLSVTGLPVGKIVLVLVILGVVALGIAAVYFLFLKPQQPQPQQAAGLIAHIHHRLQDWLTLGRLG